mmetsp:Transcript_2164/g.3971  ORF Transcript_2164/g.3971 Transcript_2164/m.3971 type:complete len:111 (+) Transcript_2164:80-412(+)
MSGKAILCTGTTRGRQTPQKDWSVPLLLSQQQRFGEQRSLPVVPTTEQPIGGKGSQKLIIAVAQIGNSRKDPLAIHASDCWANSHSFFQLGERFQLQKSSNSGNSIKQWW